MSCPCLDFCLRPRARDRKVIFLVLAEIRLCYRKRGTASAHGGVKAVLYGGLRGGRL
nr:MAG TPA: hypothetical protein [Caudoviricetes sp.]